jgi:hypothetical protein
MHRREHDEKTLPGTEASSKYRSGIEVQQVRHNFCPFSGSGRTRIEPKLEHIQERRSQHKDLAARPYKAAA